MRIRDTLKRTANLPLFPVDDFLFKNLSDRVNCAHRLDKLMHRVRLFFFGSEGGEASKS